MTRDCHEPRHLSQNGTGAGVFAFHQPQRGRMDEDQILTIAVQQDGAVRRESHMGRPHRVIPAVLVQSQVLHNNLGRTFLPADALTPEWAATSNMAPAITDHPKERGAPIAARNNRRVLDSMGVGFVDNARVEDGKLRGEVWLDEARAADVADLKAILERLDDSEPVELSTGFPLAALEETPGAHNGREYDLVIRPGPMDHLAVFAQKTGACSVTDGCGLGVNHDGACEDEAPGDAVADLESTLARVRNALGTSARSLGEALKDWRAALQADDPTPEPPNTPTPATDEPGTITDPEEGNTMNREQMIAQLAEAGPLDKEALNKLSDCQLRALHGSGTGDDEPPANQSESVAILHARIKELKQELEETKETAEPALNAQEVKRQKLIEDLIYRGKTGFSDEDVQNMTMAMLEKVHATAFRNEDYSGRGGPRLTKSGTASTLGWCRPINEAITAEPEVN